MFDQLDRVRERFAELESMLMDPEIASNINRLRKLSKEHAQLKELVDSYTRYEVVVSEVSDTEDLMRASDDDEMRELAREELTELTAERDALSERMRAMLIPRDPLDDKDIYLEIRAGTGGDEAALFAADLLRMYQRYAANRGWKVSITSDTPTPHGGFREVVARIEGDDVYSRLKFESGTHRVQRVPQTESQGRIHTSAATVAVIPEAEDVEVELDNADLKVDTYRASGAGGQHVNKTDSAIRITHLPSGVVVQCQNERSQMKNRSTAMKELKARLFEIQSAAQRSAIDADRRSQVGSGDRSERIRTYNFPESRVTDHRIGLTLYKLDRILKGDVDDLVEPLVMHHQAEALRKLDGE